SGNARDFSKYETLPLEYLERLHVQMSEYEAQFADVEENKKPSKSKRKAQEKIYRTALEKEYKASQKKFVGASGEGSVTVEDKTVQQQVLHLVKPDGIAIEVYSDEVIAHIGQRVKLNGWVNHIRFQGKQLCFIDLRDSIGVIQCVGGAGIADSEEVIGLTRETCVSIYGQLKVTKRRKVDKDEANEIVELDIDFLEVIGICPVEYSQLLNEDSEVGQRLEQRHLLLRGLKTRAIMRVRSQLLMEIRRYLYSHRFEEVSPPTLVKNSCEGGCKMFQV
ncbi:MAG: putative asparaginyl-tRNA synthetase, partial [Streblomastix strix]